MEDDTVNGDICVKEMSMQGLIDIHCHVIPAVDDGADSMKQAGRMLQREYRNHVSAVIATPHYRRGMFETPQDAVERQYERVRQMAERSRADMTVYLGCEYHCSSELVADMKAGNRPTLAGSDYVLVEFSSIHGESVIRRQVYELVTAGYCPVIAHAERYSCMRSDPELIREMMELGAQIQLTAGSVTGRFGWGTKRFCGMLLKRHLVHYIATDAHDVGERAPDLLECAGYVERKFGREYAEEIFIRNPQRIIANGKERQKTDETNRSYKRRAVLQYDRGTEYTSDKYPVRRSRKENHTGDQLSGRRGKIPNRV